LLRLASKESQHFGDTFGTGYELIYFKD